MDRILAGALGLGLIGAWVLGLSYNGPSWLAWTHLAAGLVTFGGLGTVRTPEAAGLAMWPLLTVVLYAAWLFGLAFGAPAWLGWLSFLLAGGFLFLSIVSIVPPHFWRRGRGRHIRAHA
jgi:hypothetical protein